MMTSMLIWYVQRNGKAAGPFTLGDLSEQIHQGLVLRTDLLFREGAEEWKPAGQWSELSAEPFVEERSSFTGLFTLPKKEITEKQWIVLIHHEEPDGLRFKQEGPYSTEEVQKLLKWGKVKPSDHVWKTGFEKWITIYLRDEFSANLWNSKEAEAEKLKAEKREAAKIEAARIEAEKLEAEKREAARLEAEKNEIEKFEAAKKEAARLEAEKQAAFEQEASQSAVLVTAKPEAEQTQSGVINLAKLVVNETPGEDSKKFQLPKAGQNEKKVAMVAQPLLKSKARGPKPFSGGERSSLGKWMAAGLIALVAAVSVLLQAPYFKTNWRIEISDASEEELASTAANAETPTDMPSPLDQPEAPSAQVPAPAPVQSQQQPAPPVEHPTRPPSITSQQTPPDKRPTVWSFKYVGEIGSMVTVMITGFSGQVLDVPAVNIKTEVKIEKTDKVEVDPKQLKLPQGKYLLQLFSAGKLVEKIERSLIEDPEKFKVAIANHRKQLAFSQQQEKKSLLKSLDSLQLFLREHQGDVGKKLSAKEKTNVLKSLRKIARPEMSRVRQPRHSLMYPSGWSSFVQHFEAAEALFEPGSGRKPAARPEVDSLRRKVTASRTQVSQSSLWSDD